jgi:hypothetical protein
MTYRIILGNLGSTYGLKVSKPGYDVTSTTSENLLFDSTNNNFLRSIVTGTLSLPAGLTASTSVTLGTMYGSLMLMGHLTTISTSGYDLFISYNGGYNLSLSNTGVVTFSRTSTYSLPANSVTYTIFGA